MAKPKAVTTQRRQEKQVQAWLHPNKTGEREALQVLDDLEKSMSRRQIITQGLLLLGQIDTRDIYVDSDVMLRQLYQLITQMLGQMKTMQDTINQLTQGDWTHEQRQEIRQQSNTELNEMERSIGTMFREITFDDE